MHDNGAEKPHNRASSGRKSRQVDHQSPPPHARPAPKQQIGRASAGCEAHPFLDAGKRPVQQVAGQLGREISTLVSASAHRQHDSNAITIAPATNRPGGENRVVPGADALDPDRREAGPQDLNGSGYRGQRTASRGTETEEADSQYLRNFHTAQGYHTRDAPDQRAERFACSQTGASLGVRASGYTAPPGRNARQLRVLHRLDSVEIPGIQSMAQLMQSVVDVRQAAEGLEKGDDQDCGPENASEIKNPKF